MSLTEVKLSVVVSDALGEVEVSVDQVSVAVAELSTKDGDIVTTLGVVGNVLD